MRPSCMATYVLIPGAGGEAWYWHLVVPLLESAGHRAVAVDLPAGDPDAGLEAYVAATLDAVGRPEGEEMDSMTHFLHDLPPAVLQAALDRGEPDQGERIMDDPFPLPALPPIPTRAIAATDDRFFPLAFMEAQIRDRLGVAPEHVAAGHLPALANPAGLVEVLLA
jgi:pimeloyl-ACP methyl ester carboxylesterase